MFWDRVAFIYDIFANVINAKTHRSLCGVVADEIEEDDDVLECACGTGGKIIIPTYMNRSSKGRTSGLAEAVGKAGADFKRQFTFESYQQFFAAAGYTDVKYTMIEGRVPCAVAVIRKGEHVIKDVQTGETCLCTKDEGIDYQTQISTPRWIGYDIPGNLGWIAYFTGLGISIYRGEYKYAVITAAPAALMATGIAELVDERIKGLDRTLPKKCLIRGFGALTLGGITGAVAAGVGASESSDKRIAAGMCVGGAVCATFAGLLLKEYKKTDAD